MQFDKKRGPKTSFLVGYSSYDLTYAVCILTREL